MTHADTALNALAPLVALGQERYRSTTATLISTVDPSRRSASLQPDRVLLEPMLFTFFAAGHAQDTPALGRLLDDCHDDRGPVPTTPLPGGLGLVNEYPPLFDHFFRAHDADIGASVNRCAGAHGAHVSGALEILRTVWPGLFEVLTSTVRRIVLFESDTMNSFASPAAHGAVFLNTVLGRSVPFFLEDLAHQGGHVLLAAATFGTGLFTVDPDTPVRTWTHDPHDARSVNVLFHGLLTEAFMTEILVRCLDDGEVLADEKDELTARAAFVFRRFTQDLVSFCTLPPLEDVARPVLDAVRALWHEVAVTRGVAWETFDLTNQGYNFSYHAFRAANPDAESVGAEMVRG